MTGMVKMNWREVEEGMLAARQAQDVGSQFTVDEARRAGGPDFLGIDGGDRSLSWHMGFDHAVRLARRST